ncbi:SDR family NAD(P)-dependent oxidoreductase [Microbaculum marinum]|uniref:SDR family NAD(P)-dependent oxidoreductase n=1 Tax=Microbaculum marinum TaxID=1764581 RepID=A0AAW9RID7_9HYPH
MFDPAGKTAFVTGAGSGIGLGIARRLARAGARVAMCDIRAEALEAARQEVSGISRNFSGDEALGIVVDVSDQSSVEAAADEAEARFGEVDLVVNNAGVAMHGVKIEDVALSDWDWALGVNVYGVIHGIRTFVPRLKARGSGHVVNTASIGGLQVNQTFLTGPYSTTKFAVVAISEALRSELEGTGVGVSVLCPMAVATDIHLSARSRPERLGGPHERPQDHFMGDLIKDGQSPDQVGDRLVAALRNGDFYVFTHPETRRWIEARHARIIEGFDQLDAYLEDRSNRKGAA